jgi:hypothetical protein
MEKEIHSTPDLTGIRDKTSNLGHRIVKQYVDKLLMWNFAT